MGTFADARRMAPALVGAVLALLALAPDAAAQTKHQTPVPPGFDYWQPDWMVRELWGPGRMPRGMMVRLLAAHDLHAVRRSQGLRGPAIDGPAGA